MTISGPYFRRHVFICTNERPAGHPRGCGCAGADAVAGWNWLKARVAELNLGGIGGLRINAAGCLDRCETGPALVIYPEGVWYSFRTTADLEEILQTDLIRGERVLRLLMPPPPPVAARVGVPASASGPGPVVSGPVVSGPAETAGS